MVGDSRDTTPTLLFSALHEEWLIHAPGREEMIPRADRGQADDQPCPFCPGSTETPRAYDIEILPSRHPFLPGTATSEHGTAPVHSVLLYASGHDVILADLSPQRLTGLLRRIAEHTRLLMTGGCAAVYVFEVHGDVLGPTIAHPHGQVLGFPFVPDKMTRPGRPCALCAAADMAELRLMDLETVEFGVSQWSRLPFEMLIYPRRHISELGQCSNGELRELAAGLHHALRLIGDPSVPYILNIMQVSPSKAGEHHLRIELVPFNKPNGTLKRAGACELFLGIYINPVDPVRAAALLRQR